MALLSSSDLLAKAYETFLFFLARFAADTFRIK